MSERDLPDGPETRRFGCTACGRCCNRGPEIELSEATRLADTFITSLIFKVHSLPLSERSTWARQWSESHRSRIPLRPALEESRRHLATYASRRRSERSRERETYFSISAIVNDYTPGRCPALQGKLCSIFEDRPHSCRTVPLHYSRPPSILRSYLDSFTATPGYGCDVTTAPVVLRGSTIVGEDDLRERLAATATAKADSRWKARLLAVMDDPKEAERFGLPTYTQVLTNSDSGFATLLPMLAAWRVADDVGLISSAELQRLCEQQADLIVTALLDRPDDPELSSLLPLYRKAAQF